VKLDQRGGGGGQAKSLETGEGAGVPQVYQHPESEGTKVKALVEHKKKKRIKKMFNG